MRWPAVFIMLLSAGAWAQTPQPLPGRQGYRLVDGRWVQPAGTFDFRDIVRTQLEQGRLTLELSPNETWRRRLPPNRRVLAEDRADGSLWHMLTTRLPQAVQAGSPHCVVVMLRTDESPPDRDAAPRLIRVTVTGRKTLLRAVGRHEGRVAHVEYHAEEHGAFPRLTVQIEGRGGIDLTGDDLHELISRNPAIVRRFLAPVITQLAGVNLLRPQPADVYRVFDGIDPTPAEQAALRGILPALNADDPQARERASRQLDELGFGGVLAALRLDASQLTPEQSRRIADYIARNSLGDVDPVMALQDRLFLEEAAADPDQRVRAAARAALDELRD